MELQLKQHTFSVDRFLVQVDPVTCCCLPPRNVPMQSAKAKFVKNDQE